MIFIDGEAWPPTLHGTGTEDYFNTAWCPSEEYSAPYHGVTLPRRRSNWSGPVSMYRFHIEDPVRFQRLDPGDDRARPRQRRIGNDYSSTAYWYQAGRTRPLPSCRRSSERLPRRWPEHGLWDE